VDCLCHAVQVSAMSCGLFVSCCAGVGNELWIVCVTLCRCQQWAVDCLCHVVQVSAMRRGLFVSRCAGVGNELWSAATVLWCYGVGWSAFRWCGWRPAASQCCYWLIKQGCFTSLSVLYYNLTLLHDTLLSVLCTTHSLHIYILFCDFTLLLTF